MDRFAVAEKFVSINGEGQRAGEPAVFLRFAGCNLRCSYCDTAWANQPDTPVRWESCAALCAYVQHSGIRNVTLTGGEPLRQAGIAHLIGGLLAQGNRVEIETNGSMPLAPFCSQPRPAFTMDYKLPASGMEGQMRPENFSLLGMEDTVKFVIGSAQDMERTVQIIEQYRLTAHTHVYLSAVFGAVSPREIVAFMIEHKLNDVRLQLQMHKYIWDPAERGV